MTADNIDIWRIALDKAPASAAPLTADERERAARFRFPVHRRRFIAGRHALRAIIGRYLDVDPAAIRFAYGQQGKPYLRRLPLRFNLSHSGDCAALAISWSRELGLDIEQMRPFADLLALAERFFSPAEVAVITALPSEDRGAAFYRCWTRKEAYIKARGEGLALPLDSFTVPTGPEVNGGLLSSRLGPGELLRWNLYSLPCAPGYAGAVAVERGPSEVRIQNYEFAG